MKPSASTKQAPVARTVEQFVDDLAANDLTIADWARTNNQPLNTVYALVNKRLNGQRGAARKVARAMGLQLPSITKGAGAA